MPDVRRCILFYFSLALQANKFDGLFFRRSLTCGYEDMTFQVICFCICIACKRYSRVWKTGFS